MPIISAVGVFCCDKFKETPNEKVVNMSKLTKSYFKRFTKTETYDFRSSSIWSWFYFKFWLRLRRTLRGLLWRWLWGWLPKILFSSKICSIILLVPIFLHWWFSEILSSWIYWYFWWFWRFWWSSDSCICTIKWTSEIKVKFISC